MSLNDLDKIANDFGGPPIPDQDTAEPRYPFVFLVDRSGSTAMSPPDGSEPDFVKLTAALNLLFQKLKYPQPGDPLALTHHQVDIAVLSYAEDPLIVQKWTAAPDLPASAPLFAPGGMTAMGKGLAAALDVVIGRQRRYKQQNLPKSGLPHVFHLTDGGANDVTIGGLQWVGIQERLKKLSGDPEKQKGVMYHFVSPNGYKPTPGAPPDVFGNQRTGVSVLSEWFGSDHVVPLAEGADNFNNLVQLLVRTITAVSQQAADDKNLLQQFGGRSLSDDAHN